MRSNIPYILKLKALPNLILWVRFSNGIEKTIDFKKYELLGNFAALKQQSFFEQVYLDGAFPTWPGGLDLDPDELWNIGEPYTPVAAATETHDPTSEA